MSNQRPRHVRGRIRKNPNKLSQVAIQSFESKMAEIQAENRRRGIVVEPTRDPLDTRAHVSATMKP